MNPLHLEETPALRSGLLEHGGTLLAEFSGVGNAHGVAALLGCGVSIAALYGGDPYFDIARDSTALHVAAWRASHDVVRLLIAHGAPADAGDGRGRTPLMLAVKGCVDSHWMEGRKPDSVRALFEVGASVVGVDIPCGYDEVDALLTAR